MEEAKYLQKESLRRFNMIMGGLHLLQGLLMIVLSLFVLDQIAAFEITITQIFLRYDMTLQALVVDFKNLFNLPFYFLVALFLLISAGAHALISFPKKLNDLYNADLDRGINRFRWFEYALSSSIMIVLIATLFGVRDIGSLVLIFIVNAAMNLFGLDMEIINSGKQKDKVNWGPFIWGTIAGLAPWIVIITYMAGNTEALDQVPWFVWAIVGTYFVAFNTFPINMIFQYLGVGKWKNYIYGERFYIILSLVAKSILAWLVLFGAMQP
ncbi:MAG: hypothetical protein EA375_03870 [Acholeplasmataceae bacterium]|nr:MAG: hypothetical protein EA375_03870 [Acholeplasmataceae bacterium]